MPSPEERLQELGCDEMQGFLFSQALSPEQAAELLERDSPPAQAAGGE